MQTCGVESEDKHKVILDFFPFQSHHAISSVLLILQYPLK